MKKLHLLGLMFLFLISVSSTCNKEVNDKIAEGESISKTEMPTSATKHYKAETVPNDPMKTQIFTLDNGLKVYVSVNKSAPRVQTSIAVKTGSRNDPADGTGLAHYLEHMMFKGTSTSGTIDWEKEKVLLEKISDLYEAHKNETDNKKRAELYAQIDATSQEAAKFVVANEYDKMVGSIGAKGTNAYTWVDETVYVNDIPSNALDKWLMLESNRFEMCVLRLFHTELEAVYEEFNINADRDFRKGNKALRESLFPKHPYGTQTTIGKSEHLKSPSHVQIQNYFKKYYVPNNMAIILSGDLDPQRAVTLVDRHFGSYKKKAVTPPSFSAQPKLTKPKVNEVIGQQQAYVDMGFAFDGANSDDELIITLISGIMSNGQAGIIDIDLLQKQKALSANAYVWAYKDHSVFGMDGTPREGQTLEELKDLLLAELEKVKKGEFEEWLLAAVIKDKKYALMKGMETNNGRNGMMINAFIQDKKWADVVSRYDRMGKITKDDIVKFAGANFKENYAVIYKRQGEDKNVSKVDKPKITAVPVNRKDQSSFLKKFMGTKTSDLKPVFVDFDKKIKSIPLISGVKLDYIKNTTNKTFSMFYVLEMGKNHDKTLPVAISYLPYLGTEKYTAEQLQKEFFKLGLSFNVFSGDDQVYVMLNGLDESFQEGVKLFEHILANVNADDKALKGVVADILKGREDGKKDKGTILRGGMLNYAKHGKMSSFTDNLSAEKLKALKSKDLVAKIKSLTGYEHSIFYYGSKNEKEVASVLSALHKVPKTLKSIPKEKTYPELDIKEDKVIFVNFPMVQAEVMMVSKGDKFDLNQRIKSSLYNSYFGTGMSSIVFQEIRESKALAYSAYAYNSSPGKPENSHYYYAYVGTQADKLPDAVKAMKEIINEMPMSKEQVETTRQSLLKKIESERIINTNIYWTAERNKKLGFDRDVRQDVYKGLQGMSADDVKTFQESYIKDRKYTYLVIADKEKIDMTFLKSLGKVKELTLEDVFGY